MNITKAERNNYLAYLAVGLSDGKIIIYNKNFEQEKIIAPEFKFIQNKKKTEIDKEKEQYSVSSLGVDIEGEYLFIGYKNGTILIYSLMLNDYRIGEVVQANYYDKEINCLLYENKYFSIYFLGDNEGLKIGEIKGKKTFLFPDKSASCLCLCFDENKSYLFAGFKDGIIRVYHFAENR